MVRLFSSSLDLFIIIIFFLINLGELEMVF